MADLRHQKAALERQLEHLQQEATQPPLMDDAGPAYAHAESGYAVAQARGERDTAVLPDHFGEPEPGDDGLFAYGAPAETDAGYADDAYGDSGYAEGAFADAAFTDADYADDPFDSEPFEDEPFEEDAVTDDAYGDDDFLNDEAGPAGATSPDGSAPAGEAGPPRNRRTAGLVDRGRRSARSPWLSRRRLIAVGAAAGALLLLILILVLTSGGASWPASVATVQSQITKACQNGDVASEPGQVNFACGKSTRQVLWVFSLLTSNNNPHFNDLKTGRVGLEPITPAEGGEVAWSLNLHHPYYADSPIDSLEVAARAINNIIGGATLTATGGRSEVQPGLESSPANCLRYTGSARLHARKGFPSVCARPITTPAGQAALVADVYQKWIVGSGPRAAQNAALLFENYDNPGDPQVQAVLRQLVHSPT